ncbi:hypothetical protein [Streptomyces sp. NPDC050535]|uniref:hypothetical protein n=1 Tax=Streptomyces sp. NPDC050535 TaxID=3365626 RepID=UPI00379BEBCC
MNISGFGLSVSEHEIPQVGRVSRQVVRRDHAGDVAQEVDPASGLGQYEEFGQAGMIGDMGIRRVTSRCDRRPEETAATGLAQPERRQILG